MARSTQKATIRKTGLSVSLAAAVALGTASGMAQPATASAQETVAEQAPIEEQTSEDMLEAPAANDGDQTTDDAAEQSTEESPEPDSTADATAAAEPSANEDEASQPQGQDLLAESEDAPEETELLPAAEEKTSYDPRKTEGTSAIRDQFWGTCWAQSGISSMESFLIHSGQEPTSVQFSVEDVLWWVYQGDSGWNMLNRQSSGYPPMTTGYLTTVGVRSEADIPYLGKPADFNDETDSPMTHSSNFYGEGENKRPKNYDTAPVLYEITDLIFVVDPTPQEVKDLITKYGAVSTVYKASDSEDFDNIHSSDWGNGRYVDGEEVIGANHAVSVVGWDDSFPKENFAKQNDKLPEHDGAWLLKNSFGTSYGSDGGFTYVSYDDEFIFKTDATKNMSYSYAIAGARKPTTQKRYMHDAYGAVASWAPKGSTSCTWANVFDFGVDEKLNELSFVTWSKSGTYALYYAPVVDGAPSADESTWVSLSEGEIGFAGYHTVSSGWNAAVPAGKGAILLKVTGDAPSIGTEQNINNVQGRPLFAINDKDAQGKGFFLQNGAFAEATIEGVGGTEHPFLSIRAYTVAAEKQSDDDKKDETPSGDVTPAPADDKQTRPSVGGGGKTLPKTGDEGGFVASVTALCGAALALVGTALRRVREL